MKFSSIAGHEPQIEMLRNSIKTGHLAHAYLFSGRSGVGKFSAATAFASAILCETGSGDSCGYCNSCVKIDNENHPDFIVVKPMVRDRKVTEEIDITAIRDLVRRLAYKPYESKRQVVIVKDADRMNPQAANAFLKTLEEPPGDTLIVLTATSAGKLLPTILSRCQNVRFAPLKFEQCKKFIMTRLDLDEESAGYYSSLAGGAPGRVLDESILEREKTDRESALILLEAFGGKSSEELLRLAQQIDRSKDRLTVDRLLESVSILLRDMATVKCLGKYGILVNEDLRDRLSELSARVSIRRILAGFDSISEMSAIRTYNINPLLILLGSWLEMKKYQNI